MLALFALSLPMGASAASSPMVQVAGNVAPGLAGADRLGDQDGAASIAVQLALKLRNQAELEQLITRFNDPKSPEFGHYLTPPQFAARYGPTPQQVDAAVGFLRSSGLRVTSISSNSLLVSATGPVAVATRALATSLGRYRDRRTRAEFFANDAAPRLPVSLSTVVQAVHGLDNRYHLRRAPVTAGPRLGAGAAGGYTPIQLRTAYGLTTAPLTAADGTGQSIGIFELDGYDQSHIAAYDRQFFNPLPPTPVPVAIDGGATRTPGGQVEVELDIEVAHAMAPGATAVIYEAPNTFAGINDAYSAMVAGGTRTNSTSWGLCEANQGPSETATLHSIFSQAAAQGQTLFAASGDSGAYDCDPTQGGTLSARAVDSPASDPLVTGVGGTSMILNGNNTYAGETAWGGPLTTQPEGSGGGNSNAYAQPTWQSSVHRPQNLSTMRQVPDVALDGDPQTGYAIFSNTNSSGTQAGWTMVGGTSAAAPGWAGFAAVYDQYACVSDRPGLGNANPQLYQAATSTTFLPFNDVTTGNSGNATFWSAAAGWDYATGLGSLRASDLAQALTAGVSAGTAQPHINMIVNGTAGASGPPLGGNLVDVHGCGFRQDTAINPPRPPSVHIGSNASPQVTWIDSTHLRVVVPPHNGGLVDVTVANPSGATDLTRSGYLYAATTGGYSVLNAAGAIYSFGDAQYRGNLLDHGYPGPAVGLAETANGLGYNILTAGGGIYSFGNASYYGNLIDHGFPGPAVALSYTPTGGGYGILTRAGGLYTFGDAQGIYFGNLIDHGYPGAAVSLAYTPTGRGYLILTSSGAIYSFGDAPYFGNLLDHRYPGVAVSLNMTRSGGGYSILTGSGALYSFGDAPYYGNLLDHGYPGPAAAISDTP
jgi:Pro-kumamolisin, activation domain/IPT/TIG domain